MNGFILSFKDKRLRYGTFSTVMILIVIAVLVVINLVVGQLNLKYDMTNEGLYSISDGTKKVLSELEMDVTIYPLYKTGEENFMFSQILEQYKIVTDKVKLEFKDPYLYPAFVSQYAGEGQTIPAGSIIIESAYRYKVVLADELISREFDMNTFSYNTTSIDIEPRVTNAIHYVTTKDTPTIYILEGHGEVPIPENLISQMQIANYDVKTIDILDSEIPEDCNVLLISTPTYSDWAPDEAEKIKTFLQNNGRAFFIISYMLMETPNLDSVLYSYGAKIGNYLVIEGNPNNFMLNTPYYVRPDFTESEIVQELTNQGERPLLYPANAVEATDIKKNSVKVEPLLISSRLSYGRVDPNISTVNKDASDLDGPFVLAAAITDSYYTTESYLTKLVIIPCVYILDESMNGGVRGANWNFFIHTMNWLQDKTDNIYIRSKSPTTNVGVLSIVQSDALRITVVCAVVIPLIIVAIGLFVWLRRRHA